MWFKIQSAGSNIVSLKSNTDISDQAWHLVTMTRDSGAVYNMYIDGVFETTVTDSDYDNFVGKLYFGSKGLEGSLLWPGKIDEVRIYNRALSATEITKLYNLGK